jgi:hypothetical protein
MYSYLLGLSSSVRIAHTACYWKFFLVHYIQVLCQYGHCKADLNWYKSKSKSKSHCDWWSISKSWCQTPSGAHGQIYITVWQLWSCFVGFPLWREDGSVFCIWCWPLPAQSFSGPSPLGLSTVFYCLSFETSLFVASYDSQGHDGGIRQRLHTGFSELVKIKVTLRLTVSQSWCRAPPGAHDQIWKIIVSKTTPRRGPHWKHRSSIVPSVFVSSGTCLESRCSAAGCITPLFYYYVCMLSALPSNDRCLQTPWNNGSICHNINYWQYFRSSQIADIWQNALVQKTCVSCISLKLLHNNGASRNLIYNRLNATAKHVYADVCQNV